METHIVKIKSIEKVTHDVRRFVIDKPVGYHFTPGQATEISINKMGWEEEKRPFTFTCLPQNDYLEFTIKTYPERKGLTNELLTLKSGDELIIRDVWGAITYTNEGIFIAGGAGVTPFISIFRHLHSKNEIGHNKLIFANKTKQDIILESEFKAMLGNAFINILSQEKTVEYHYGMINEDFLRSIISDFNQQFYVCGPPPMMDAVLHQLVLLGVGKNAITVEI
ncbi:MAG TPA: flavodoxin reductase [Prolixibacteraceae bacterium]|jgi:ferredoxin-NADP reductase|nr:flavodoxin reductase [Prolixibacteraceae bacterium]